MPHLSPPPHRETLCLLPQTPTYATQFAERVAGIRTLRGRADAVVSALPPDPLRGDVEDPLTQLHRRTVVIETKVHTCTHPHTSCTTITPQTSHRRTVVAAWLYALGGCMGKCNLNFE
jgi:hypothetical protein